MFIKMEYEVVSNIFRTGVAIYIEVVVAWSTVPNRQNWELRVLLQTFGPTAWKRAKTLPRTLARTDLAASPSQRPVSHFRPHPEVSGVIRNVCRPPPTVCPRFGTLWLLRVSRNKIEAERTLVWYHWGDPSHITESAWHSDRKRTSRRRFKNGGDGGSDVYMREGTTSRVMNHAPRH
jgi:hypothetical protein